jgi:hypothetical protein
MYAARVPGKSLDLRFGKRALHIENTSVSLDILEKKERERERERERRKKGEC